MLTQLNLRKEFPIMRNQKRKINLTMTGTMKKIKRPLILLQATDLKRTKLKAVTTNKFNDANVTLIKQISS